MDFVNFRMTGSTGYSLPFCRKDILLILLHTDDGPALCDGFVETFVKFGEMISAIVGIFARVVVVEDGNALRSGAGAKSGESGVVPFSTKEMVDCFSWPSFHDGRRSAARAMTVARPKTTTSERANRALRRLIFIVIPPHTAVEFRCLHSSFNTGDRGSVSGNQEIAIVFRLAQSHGTLHRHLLV